MDKWSFTSFLSMLSIPSSVFIKSDGVQFFYYYLTNKRRLFIRLSCYWSGISFMTVSNSCGQPSGLTKLWPWLLSVTGQAHEKLKSIFFYITYFLAWPSGLGRWIWNLKVPGSNLPPCCYLDLFSVVPSSTPRPRCVDNELVSLPPVGILNKFIIIRRM